MASILSRPQCVKMTPNYTQSGCVKNPCLRKSSWSQELNTLHAKISSQWRHNEWDGVSNHQPHDCLLRHFFRLRSKKTAKLSVTGLCEGNSPVTGAFPAQRASNAENITIWWRHHVWTWLHGAHCPNYKSFELNGLFFSVWVQRQITGHQVIWWQWNLAMWF